MVSPARRSAGCSPAQAESSRTAAASSQLADHRRCRRPRRQADSATEVIQQDVLRLHPEIFQHLDAGGIHHRGTTEVVLAVLGSWVVLEVVFIEVIVDEARRPLPVVLGKRDGQGQETGEVVVFRLQMASQFISVLYSYGDRSFDVA